MAVSPLAEAFAGAPPPEHRVPACETNSRCEIFHDALKVVDASSRVNPRPTKEVPFVEMCSYFLLHVEVGELS